MRWPAIAVAYQMSAREWRAGCRCGGGGLSDSLGIPFRGSPCRACLMASARVSTTSGTTISTSLNIFSRTGASSPFNGLSRPTLLSKTEGISGWNFMHKDMRRLAYFAVREAAEALSSRDSRSLGRLGMCTYGCQAGWQQLICQARGSQPTEDLCRRRTSSPCWPLGSVDAADGLIALAVLRRIGRQNLTKADVLLRLSCKGSTIRTGEPLTACPGRCPCNQPSHWRFFPAS